MFVDQLKLPSEAQLNQVLHTLDHVHRFAFDSFDPEYLQTVNQQFEQSRSRIVESSAFNTYLANPDYVKASLVLEAVRLLREIAPARRRQKIKERTQHKDIPMKQLSEKAAKRKPDFLDVDKDGNTKEPMVKALKDKAAKKKLKEDQNLDQAETLLAAKDLSDQLQDMAEDAAKMAVDRLMPLVDTMKAQFGQPAAEGFNTVVKDNLQKVLDTIIAAKDQTDNAILTLQGGGTPEMASDISQPLPAEPGAPAPEGEEGADIDFDKEFDAMASTSGPEQEPLGRAKKSELDEGRHDGNAYEMGYRAGVNDRSSDNPFEGKDEFRAGEWEDGYKDGRKEAGLDENATKCMECGSGMYETHKSGHMICNECGSRMIAEKIEGGVKTHAARAGMFKDWNMGELRSELAKVKKRMTGYKDRDEKVPHKLRTRFSQLTFAIRAKTGWGKVEEALSSTDQKKQEELAHAAAEQMIKTRKSPDGKPATPQQMADAKKMVAEAKKAKSPYAVGMAKAMELTGDKPPLKKTTIKKAHEIARSVEKDLKESVELKQLSARIALLSENFNRLKTEFTQHRAHFKKQLQEGSAIDPLQLGYGLEGTAILQKMRHVKGHITEAATQRKALQQKLNEAVLIKTQMSTKIQSLDQQLQTTPYGVVGIDVQGQKVRRFFETQSHRDMWLKFNKRLLQEHVSIDPQTIKEVQQKLKKHL